MHTDMLTHLDVHEQGICADLLTASYESFHRHCVRWMRWGADSGENRQNRENTGPPAMKIYMSGGYTLRWHDGWVTLSQTRQVLQMGSNAGGYNSSQDQTQRLSAQKLRIV